MDCPYETVENRDLMDRFRRAIFVAKEDGLRKFLRVCFPDSPLEVVDRLARLRKDDLEYELEEGCRLPKSDLLVYPDSPDESEVNSLLSNSLEDELLTIALSLLRSRKPLSDGLLRWGELGSAGSPTPLSRSWLR